MGYTVKALLDELQKERYDTKNTRVKVCLSSGERLDVIRVNLDTDVNEVELTVSGAEQTQPETPDAA